MLRKVRLAAWCSVAVGGGFAGAAGLDGLLFAESERAAHDRRFDEVMSQRALIHDLRQRELDLVGRLLGGPPPIPRAADWPEFPGGAEVDDADRIPPQQLPVTPAKE